MSPSAADDASAPSTVNSTTGSNGKPRRSAKSNDRRIRAGAARLAAVQGLYLVDMATEQGETGATDVAIEQVIRDFIQGRLGGSAIVDIPDPDGLFDPTEEVRRLAPPDGELFAFILRGAFAELDRVDETLRACLSGGWQWDRLEPIVKAILRAGIYELLARSDTPPRVAVKEYVELADAFYTGPERAMVNAVMDRVARTVRPEDFSADGRSEHPKTAE